MNRVTEHLPQSLERWNGTCPVHGQEKQPGGRLTDIVNVKIIGHRRRHGELQKKVGKEERKKCRTIILLSSSYV